MMKKQAKNRRNAGQFAPGVSGNPAGRPPKVEHLDSWENVVTNLGTSRDPRSGARYTDRVVSSMTARSLWRTNDLAARVIETHASEALRRSFNMQLGEGMAEEADKIMDALKLIPGPTHVGKGVTRVMLKALQYEAAYGGAAIWPVISGAQGDLDEPLDETKIVSVDRLVLFEPRELRPLLYYADPEHPKYGEPAIYEVQPLSTRGGPAMGERPLIHESRLIIFPGIRVSREEQPGTDVGWGDNKLSRIYQVLADFDLSFAGAAALLAKFSQVVFKLKGLATAQATNHEFKTHLEAMNTAGSILNAWVVDSDDDVQRLTISMGGLPETLDKMMLRLAAAANMPVALLMGQSPAGLQATGSSDIRFFYDSVELLREHLKPMLEQLVKWVLLSSAGPTSGTEPESWSIEFPPLWEMDDSEETTNRKTQAETDQIYYEMGALSPEEIAINRFGGDAYSYDTKIDVKAREAQMPAAPIPPGTTLEGDAPAEGDDDEPEPEQPKKPARAARTEE